MMNEKKFSFIRIFSFLILLVMATQLMNCASKKKAQEAVEAPTEVAFTNTPIQFDHMGSDSGNIGGLNTVYFDFDQYALTPATIAALKNNAQWIKTNKNVKLQLEGHCDSRGSIEYNLGLGERRAKAVRDYLVKLGIPKDRLSIISYGKERPIALGDSEEAHAKNRRVNFVPLK